MILLMTEVEHHSGGGRARRELVRARPRRRRALEIAGTDPKALEIEPGGSRSWLQVNVADERSGCRGRRSAASSSVPRPSTPRRRRPTAERLTQPSCPSRTIPTTGSGADGPVHPGPAVVFDMDGVLSDAAGRQHYLERPYRDSEAFFAACGDDQLIDEVARLLEVLDPTCIVLLTARPIRVQRQTLGWLERYQLRWDLLIMRDYGDYDASRDFKQRTVAELRPASTCAWPSRTTAATTTCSTPRASPASTSTPATTSESAGPRRLRSVAQGPAAAIFIGTRLHPVLVRTRPEPGDALDGNAGRP